MASATQIVQPAPRLFTADEYYAMRDAGIFGERERLELIDGRLFYAYAPDKPRLFSVEDFHAMGDAGVFGEDERVELLNGVIIEMPPIRKWHRSSVYALGNIFSVELGNRLRNEAIVGVQNVIRLEDNRELLPDIAILRSSEDYYFSTPPGPADILLIGEVSDTSLRYDLEEKLPAYAEAGIPETWIANIPSRRIEVYTDPANGEYQSRGVFGVGESVSPSAFPDVSIPVDRVAPA